MKPLVILSVAHRDLSEIRDHSVTKWGLATWEKRAVLFDKAMDRVRRFPAAGQNRSNYLSRMRSVNVQPHVIFYREDKEVIVIIRVVDGRRDLPKLSYSAP